MSRYFLMPARSLIEYVSDHTTSVEPSSKTVWDDGPIDTGVLDADGNPILRGSVEIGFLSK